MFILRKIGNGIIFLEKLAVKFICSTLDFFLLKSKFTLISGFAIMTGLYVSGFLPYFAAPTLGVLVLVFYLISRGY